MYIICIYMYMCIYIYMYIYIFIFMYITHTDKSRAPNLEYYAGGSPCWELLALQACQPSSCVTCLLCPRAPVPACTVCAGRRRSYATTFWSPLARAASTHRCECRASVRFGCAGGSRLGVRYGRARSTIASGSR